MNLYPAFLALAGRKCIVIGSSPVARNRALALAGTGAEVTLFGLDTTDQHRELAGVVTVNRPVMADDLNECWLAIGASDNPQENHQLSQWCEQRQILCNTINRSNPDTFVLPSVVDRSPLVIAIASGGVAPALSRTLKTRLESLIPASYRELTQILGRYKEKVSTRIPNRSRRAAFWHSLINGHVGELSLEHDTQGMERAIDQALKAFDSKTPQPGFVSLVGAGPGDPDLLTFKALRLIQSADTVVYDRLVSDAIMQLCRTDAELVYAGKAKADHAIPQQSINQLLVDLAREGKQVVRLKGGDPFIFGRGGEEMETLMEQRIGFQVIPGITAAAGCASYSGIPLTHRDHAQSCVFVTGHLQSGEINLNWESLVDPDQTVVVYMGLTALEKIAESLIKHGRDPATPAALIQQGTTPNHRVYTGTLEGLPALVAQYKVVAPTLLIIGSVVTLREQLGWFHDDDVIASE